MRSTKNLTSFDLLAWASNDFRKTAIKLRAADSLLILAVLLPTVYKVIPHRFAESGLDVICFDRGFVKRGGMGGMFRMLMRSTACCDISENVPF